MKIVKGDTGILQWKRHSKYVELFELFVVWEKDPSNEPRRTNNSAIEVIGVLLRQK